jgi:hypothetical protein
MTAEMVAALPDGSMIHDGKIAYALHGGQASRWSFAGYGNPVDLSSLDMEALHVLTPETSGAVLRAGYKPVWHPSAG